MAQTNMVQREPSMEEILASIRRIIEDSDSARKPADQPETRVEPAVPAASSVIEVEAFRQDLRRLEPVAEPKPSSLAEVKAQLRSEPAPAALQSFQTTAAAPEHAVEPGASATRAEPEEAFAHRSVPVAEPPIGSGDEAEDDMMADLSLPNLEEAVRESIRVPASFDARPAILSERTGRQVAAAFGELNEALAVSRRQSLDEMAEEMLRPMLQDWLDNNLPTLVERLVREEIERVARGVPS